MNVITDATTTRTTATTGADADSEAAGPALRTLEYRDRQIDGNEVDDRDDDDGDGDDGRL